MSSRAAIIDQQRRWAQRNSLAADADGYLNNVSDNLFQPLTARTKRAFSDGSGGELDDKPSRPAKMRALHSSSALAVNFFDYWTERGRKTLYDVLGLESPIESVSFEEKYPAGLRGTPPNLDVILKLENSRVIGVESKFCEWLSRKQPSRVPFKDKYFPQGEGLWVQRGLPNSQQLAESIAENATTYQHLDAPQLLKHSLGLANQLGKDFSLFYFFYDWPGEESDIHWCEIMDFSNRAGEEIRFRAVTYQEIFSGICSSQVPHLDYTTYLADRYFRNDQANTI